MLQKPSISFMAVGPKLWGVPPQGGAEKYSGGGVARPEPTPTHTGGGEEAPPSPVLPPAPFRPCPQLHFWPQPPTAASLLDAAPRAGANQVRGGRGCAQKSLGTGVIWPHDARTLTVSPLLCGSLHCHDMRSLGGWEGGKGCFLPPSYLGEVMDGGSFQFCSQWVSNQGSSPAWASPVQCFVSTTVSKSF